jgi:hypothetical protein
MLGASLGDLAVHALNVQGSTLIFLALFLFGLTVFTDLSWFRVMDLTGKITLDLLELIHGAITSWWNARSERKQMKIQLRELDERVIEVAAPVVSDRREQARVKERLLEREEALSKHMSERERRPAPVIATPPVVKAPEPSKRVQKEKQAPLFVDSAVEGTLPPISLLDPAEAKKVEYSPESLKGVGHLLEIKLKEFGVEVAVDSIHPGPVITRYEIQPAAGVKVSRIANLAQWRAHLLERLQQQIAATGDAVLQALHDELAAYPVGDALTLVKECATAKFDESIDVSVNLGIDAKKSDQLVRGSVVLPSGTGKTVRVAVFAQGAKAEDARAAGADVVGFDDLAADVKAGNMNFDIVIATPDAMKVVGALGGAVDGDFSAGVDQRVSQNPALRRWVIGQRLHPAHGVALGDLQRFGGGNARHLPPIGRRGVFQRPDKR